MKVLFAAAEGEWIKDDQQGELFERSEFLPCRLSSFQLREIKMGTCTRYVSPDFYLGIGCVSLFTFFRTRKESKAPAGRDRKKKYSLNMGTG